MTRPSRLLAPIVMHVPIDKPIPREGAAIRGSDVYLNCKRLGVLTHDLPWHAAIETRLNPTGETIRVSYRPTGPAAA